MSNTGVAINVRPDESLMFLVGASGKIRRSKIGSRKLYVMSLSMLTCTYVPIIDTERLGFDVKFKEHERLVLTTSRLLQEILLSPSGPD